MLAQCVHGKVDAELLAKVLFSGTLYAHILTGCTKEQVCLRKNIEYAQVQYFVSQPTDGCENNF